jgi:hypothetical protein
MSDDDERLRRALEAAHGPEAPPAFRALVERRRRRRPMVLAPLALAAAVAAALLLWPHAPPPPPRVELSSLRLSSRGPLDFLLHLPGDDALLAQTPRFDGKGDWP